VCRFVQISPGHIWTTLYSKELLSIITCIILPVCLSVHHVLHRHPDNNTKKLYKNAVQILYYGAVNFTTLLQNELVMLTHIPIAEQLISFQNSICFLYQLCQGKVKRHFLISNISACNATCGPRGTSWAGLHSTRSLVMQYQQ